MYMDLYGLREQPFGVTPNPRFLYFSTMHKAALTSLVNSVCERRGFSALIAKPGMGKTSLIMQLLTLVRDTARTAFLFQAHGTTQEFLNSLLQDLEAPPASMDLADMQKALNEAAVREARANRQLIIIVDEAQNLADETLEAIRLLSNFENPETKLLHILFAGQPPLADKLASPNLAQLRQRLSVVTHLTPLTREQVGEYIQCRLKVAGYSGESLFAADALDFVAQASEGIPRNINNLCFHALSLGFAARTQQLDLGMVQQAARALDLKIGPQFYARIPPIHVNEGSYSNPVGFSARIPPRLEPLPPRYWNAGRPHLRKKSWSPLKVGTGSFLIAGMAYFAFLIHGGEVPPGILALLPHSNSLQTNQSVTVPAQPALAQPAPAAPPPTPPTAGSSDAGISSATTNTTPPAPDVQKPDTAQAALSESTPPVDTRIVRTERREDLEQLTRHYFGMHTGDVLPIVLKLNPGIATPPAPLPAGTPVMIPATSESATANISGAHSRSSYQKHLYATAPKRNTSRIPVHVRIHQPETIFQFAMEHYGKADLSTVEKIRAANPQIQDIYQTLREGQSMTLPPNLDAVD